MMKEKYYPFSHRLSYLKVKIFGNGNADKLEETVNEFIKDKNVIDIQFSPMVYRPYSVMIVYEEELT